MHPTPSMQSVPSVAAANSGPVPTMTPTWMTPPETPIPAMPYTSGRTHSASSSVSGVINPNDIRPSTEIVDAIAEESEKATKRESETEVKEQRPEKRRRIEPTLVAPPE
jgi:chromatin assembly factor 1 subunit B